MRQSDQQKDLGRLLGESDSENREQGHVFQKVVYIVWAVIATLIYFSPLSEILF